MKIEKCLGARHIHSPLARAGKVELVYLVASGDCASRITLYVIENIDNKFRYIGITNNLEKRLEQHNNGCTKSTKGRGPFKLKLTESFGDYKEARVREIFLKSGQGRKMLDSI